MKRSSLLKSLTLLCALSLSALSYTTMAQNKPAADILPAILSLLLNNVIDPIDCPAPGAPGALTATIENGFAFIVSQDQIDSFGQFSTINGGLIFVLGGDQDSPFPSLSSDTDFSPLDSVLEITGNVSFQFLGDDPLDTLDVFPCLREVGGQGLFLGEPEITTDTGLRKIKGFENLTAVNGLFIAGHDDLEEVPSFDSLEEIGSLTVFETPQLRELPNFGSLTTIREGLSIGEAGIFTEIAGFPVLENFATNPQLERQSLIDANPNLECVDENGVPNVPALFLPATSSFGNATDCPVDP